MSPTAALVIGLIVAAALALGLVLLWLRQRAHERLDRRRRIGEARRRIGLVARVAALEHEFTRSRMIDQVMAEYGPSRGDAE